MNQLQRGTDVEEEQSIVANRGSKKDAEGEIKQEEHNREGEQEDDEEVSEASRCRDDQSVTPHQYSADCPYSLRKRTAIPKRFLQ